MRLNHAAWRVVFSESYVFLLTTSTSPIVVAVSAAASLPVRFQLLVDSLSRWESSLSILVPLLGLEYSLTGRLSGCATRAQQSGKSTYYDYIQVRLALCHP